MSEQVRLLDSQVSGKNAKFTDTSGVNIYKKLSPRQYKFYEYINSLRINSCEYSLKKFLPKFIGMTTINTSNVIYSNPQDCSKRSQWMSHMSERNKMQSEYIKQFIILENLTKGYQYPCLVDIKLGKKKTVKSSNKKFQKSTTNSHNFRINGMSNLFVEQKESHFISKYYFQKTSQEQIQSHIAFFFFDGVKLDLELIKKCIQQTKQIILALQSFKNGRFQSASLLICYDAYDHCKFTVKLIDFDKYELSPHEHGDQNIIVGLKYIVWYLNNICLNSKSHEDVILSKNMGIFQNFENIPKQKIKQFTSLSPKLSPTKGQQPEIEQFSLQLEVQ